MPPWRRLQACDRARTKAEAKAKAAASDGRGGEGYQSGSSFTVETWALTTFHPRSGKRTQV